MFISTVICITAGTAAGAILTVDDDGIANYSNIQDAVSNATIGDTIVVYSGTYTEHVSVNKQVALKGQDTGDGIPIIDGAGSGNAITINANGVMVEGFNITGSSRGIYLYSDSNIITNNIIPYNYYGLYFSLSHNNTLIDNRIINNNYGIYSSYSNDNTIFNNNVSDNSNYGIYLYNSHQSTLTSNNVSHNNYYGIYLYNSHQSTLTSNNVFYNYYGIYLYNSQQNTLSSNNVSHNNYYGIYLYNSQQSTLTSNTMIGNINNFYLYGNSDIHFDNNISISNTIDGKPIYYIKNAVNTVYDNSTNAGIFYCIWCTNVTIKDLSVEGYYGIYLRGSNDSHIYNINSSFNQYGFYLYNSNNNILKGNTANSNSNDGFYLYNSNNNTLQGNTANSNSDDGFYSSNSNNNTIQNNTANLNSNVGFYSSNSNNNTIQNNTANSNYYGVYIYNSNNDTIQNNTANSNDYVGFYSYNSNNDTIQNNTANLNYYGFRVYYSMNCKLSENNISNNSYYGLYLYNSQQCTLTSNTMADNGYNFYLRGSNDPHFDNDIGTNNTVNGKPIYYIQHAIDTIYGSSTNAGVFYCIWCDNVTIKDLSFSQNGYGVYLRNTTRSHIENINSSSNYLDGFFSYNVTNNTFSNNTVNSNNDDGFDFDQSDNNTLSGNIINFNRDDGIQLYHSNNNSFTNNNISENYDNGVYIYNSNNNVINSNRVVDNRDLDFYVRSSTNSGDNNTCDKADGWNDNGVTGCKYLSKPLSSYPDFIVDNITWSPHNLSLDEYVTFNATIKNIGPANFSGIVYVGFYINEEYITSAYIYNINVNQSVYVTRSWYVNRAGVNNLTVKADYNNHVGETDETNNELSVTLPAVPGPDLIIDQLSWSPSPYSSGDTVTFTATVKNIGNLSTKSTYHYVHFYIDDVYIGYGYYYNTLAPDQNFTITRSWSAIPGNHNISARVDISNYIPEINESNNALSMNLPYVQGSDLIISNITWSPTNYSPGDTITFSANVTNIGDVSTGSYSQYVYFYIDGSYIGYSYKYVYIDVGESVLFTRTWVAQGGNHTVKANADYNNYIKELNESNNTKEVSLPSIASPDFIITNITWTPVNFSAGDSIILNATIKNIGTGRWSGSTQVHFYYKNTSYISYTNPTLNLQPGDVGYATITWSDAQAGDYYFMAQVDLNNYISESNETNNKYYAQLNNIPKPDLIVDNINLTTQHSVVLRGDQNDGIFWRYTTTAPASGWQNITFDDSNWTLNKTSIGDDYYYYYSRTILDLNGGSAYFRKIFDSAAGSTHTLRIASDDGVDAWINGVQVISDSASTHSRSYWNYQVDITPYIQDGDNIIAVYLRDGGGANYFDAEITRTSSSATIEAGDLVTINATIKNIGPGNLSSWYIYNTLYVNGNSVSTRSKTFALPVNATDIITFTWTATTGANSIKVMTDNYNYVEEVNETNNYRTLDIPRISYPDLIVEDIYWSPADYSAGQTVTIYGIIKNTGPGYVGRSFYTYFYIDGNSYSSTSYSGIIPPGGSITVSRPWTAQGGNHTVRVLADVYSYITEVNEYNNELTKDLISVSYPDIIIANVTASKDEIVLQRGDLWDNVYWNYTTETPSSGWHNLSFNDSNWNRGKAPIGDVGYRTYLDLNCGQAYFRKTFNTTHTELHTLKIASDDGVDVWINGMQVLSNSGDGHGRYYWNYEKDITSQIQTGENIIAIYLRDGGCGYNYIDAQIATRITENVSQINVSSGELITFNSTLKNIGSGDLVNANLYSSYYIDGTHITSGSVRQDLPVGGTAYVTGTWIATPGLHTFKAKADIYNYIIESNEGNNEYASGMNFIPYPDLIIEDLFPVPGVYDSGESVTLTARVKNNGNGSLISSYIRVDFNIDDSYVCARSEPTSLYPGDITNISCTWTATAGKQNLSATVDRYDSIRESNESNNYLKVSLIPTKYPDFIVSNLSWSPSTYEAGEQVSLIATVQNIGLGNTSNTYNCVDFYIDGSYIGRRCGYTTVPANGTFEFTRSWTATAGNHTVKAVADSTNRIQESNESNNAVTIALPSTQFPDFIVKNITWSPISFEAGDSITFTATVQNIGSGGVATSYKYVGFYVDNSLIGANSAYTAVPVNGTFTISKTWIVTPGNHSVKAIADHYNNIPESDETNNDYTIQLPSTSFPDLVVSDISWSSTAGLSVGEQVSITATIENIGPGSFSSCFNTRFDVDVSSVGIGRKCGLASGESFNTSVLWTVQPGIHSIKVIADSSLNIPESNEANNERIESTGNITIPEPDFVVSDIVVRPPTAIDGLKSTITATVSNLGPGSSVGGYLNIKFFVDGIALGQEKIFNGITVGDSKDVSVPWLAASGNHTIQVISDYNNYYKEANESNNERTEYINYEFTQSDLNVSSISLSKTELFAGDYVKIHANVKNLGEETRRCVEVAFYVDGSRIGSVQQRVACGILSNQTLISTYPWYATPGNHNITVVADSSNIIPEPDETNNEMTYVVPFIPYSDLIITNVTYSPTTNVQPGDTVAITVTVKNNDTGDVSSSVGIRAQIAGSSLGATIYGGIGSGESKTATLRWSAISGSNFNIVSQVDPYNRIAESDELNNKYTQSMPLTVPYPDLIVENITWNPTTNIRDEDTVSFNITIKNIGAARARNIRPSVMVGNQRIYGSISSIKAGASGSAHISWRARVGENISVSGDADYYNIVQESDESNNHLDAAEIGIVLPKEKFTATILPGSSTAGFGSSKLYTIQINNFGSATSNYSVSISGLNSSWYTLLEDSVYLGTGEKANIILNVTVPDNCTVNTSTKTIKANITSIITGANLIVTSQMHIDPGYTISELRPGTNSKVGSTTATISWKTTSNATTRVFVRPDGETNWTEFTGTSGTFHSVAVTNLTRNALNYYYVMSNTSCGSGISEIRTIYVDNGISFTTKDFTFNVERDYDQKRALYIKNTDSKSRQVKVQVINPYEDLIVGFVGGGSVDTLATVNPGETKKLDFRIHTQDATLKRYDILVNLTNFDTNGVEQNITDFAAVHINVHVPNFNFTFEEIDSNPLNLEKTFRITNHGDPITDLALHADDSIKNNLTFNPSFDHAYLRSQQSLTFVATPILNVGTTGFNGTLFISGAGRNVSLPVDFHTPPGEMVYYGMSPVTEIIFSPIFDGDDSNQTNPLNGSVVDSVLANGSVVYVGDIVALVEQGGKPVFGTNVSLTISDGGIDTILYSITDPLGLAQFRVHMPVGNYSYKAQVLGLGVSTETRNFSVNATPSISFEIGIEWVNISDFDSSYPGTADNIVLDSAPYVITASAISIPVNATPLLVLSWDFMPNQKITLQGTFNGSILHFETSGVSPGNYTAMLMLMSESSYILSETRNISFTDESYNNFEEYTIVRHFQLNDSDGDNLTSQTLTAKKLADDPRKFIMLKDISLNDEKTEFIYTFAIGANESINDTLFLDVKDQNETLIYHTERNISLIPGRILEVNVSVPVEYTQGQYTIEVTTLDLKIVQWVVSNGLQLVGVPEKWADVVGLVVNCAVGFSPFGVVTGAVDLGVAVYDMITSPNLDTTMNTVGGVGSNGLNAIGELTGKGARYAGQVSTPWVKTLGKFGGPILGCISDLIDVIKELQKEGTTVSQTQNNWRCTNKPVVNDIATIPPSIPQYLEDGSPNIDNIMIETRFDDFWARDGLAPFDTIYEWNGYRFGGLYNDIPVGPYSFNWPNPDSGYIHTSSTGTGQNYLTTYTRGLNPGHYAQNYETTINIHVRQMQVLVIAANQDQANQRVAMLASSKIEKPDAVIPVRGLTIDNPSPIMGDTVNISATVHNFGTQYLTKVKVYFYVNGNIIGEREQYLIPPSEYKTTTIPYTVLDTGDTFTVLAKADPLNKIDEEDETNNDATLVVPISTGTAPDFTPTDIVFSPTSPTVNDTITATVTVKNTGNISGPHLVNVSLDVHSTTQHFASILDMTGLRVADIDFTFTAEVGDHTVTTTLDSNNTIPEGNENNNVKSVVLHVNPAPDEISPVIEITYPENNSTFNESDIRVTGIASDASGIANVTVNGILATGTTNWSVNITLRKGANTITAVATDNSKNTQSDTVVVYLTGTKPDLTPNIDIPTQTRLNQSTEVIFTVYNIGQEQSNNTILHAIFDGVIHNISVPSINASHSWNYSYSWTPDSIGTHIISAIVDPLNTINEKDETNNFTTKRTITRYVDLVTSITAPSTISDDRPVTIWISVSNNGDYTSEPTNLNLYANGALLHNISVSSIGAHRGFSRSYSWTPSVNGPVVLNSTIDPNNLVLESNELNNNAARIVQVRPFKLSAWYMKYPHKKYVGNSFWVSASISSTHPAIINATINLPEGLSTTTQTKTFAVRRGNYNSVWWLVRGDELGIYNVSVTVSAQNTTSTIQSNDTQWQMPGAIWSYTPHGPIYIVEQTVVVKDLNSTILYATSQDNLTYRVFDVNMTDQSTIINLAGGVEGRLLLGLEYLVGYPHGCPEQTMSPTLASLRTKQYYETRGVLTSAKNTTFYNNVRKGVARMSPNGGSNPQQTNGGWAWGTGTPHRFYTLYTTYGMANIMGDANYSHLVKDAGIDLNRSAVWITGDQQSDGNWSGGGYISGNVAMSGFAMVALGESLPYLNTTMLNASNVSLENGAQYLISKQIVSSGIDNGGWNSNGGSSSADAYSTSLALLGIAKADNDSYTQQVNNATKWLVNNQKPSDGSWGKYPGHSSSSYSSSGANSEATAYAILALNATGLSATNDSVVRGVNYLVGVYQDSGSWGSTRTTQMAIHALTLFQSTEMVNTNVTVVLENVLNVTHHLDATHTGVRIKLNDSQRTQLGAGNHTINISTNGTGRVIVGVESRQIVPKTEANAKVPARYIDPISTTFFLEMSMPEDAITGQTVLINATIDNHEDNSQNVMVLDIPLSENVTVPTTSPDNITYYIKDGVKTQVQNLYNATERRLYVYPGSDDEISVEANTTETYYFNLTFGRHGDNTVEATVYPMYNPTLMALGNVTGYVKGYGNISISSIDGNDIPISTNVTINSDVKSGITVEYIAIDGAYSIIVERAGTVPVKTSVNVIPGVEYNYTAVMVADVSAPTVIFTETEATAQAPIVEAVNYSSVYNFTVATTGGLTTIAMAIPVNHTFEMAKINGVNVTAINDSGIIYLTAELDGDSQVEMTFEVIPPIYRITSGWNMISLPVLPANSTVSEIFGDNVTTVYGWTGTAYQYLDTSAELESKKGYWILSRTEYERKIFGDSIVDTNHTLTAGWNMVGPVTGEIAVNSLDVKTVYGWSGTMYNLLSGTQKLELTKGYWMLVNETTVIQI